MKPEYVKPVADISTLVSERIFAASSGDAGSSPFEEINW